MATLTTFDVASRATRITNLATLEKELQLVLDFSDSQRKAFPNRPTWDGSQTNAQTIINDHLDYNSQISREIKGLTKKAAFNMVWKSSPRALKS